MTTTSARTYWPLALLGIIAAFVARGPSHAAACGGPVSAEFHALQPVQHAVSRMQYPDPMWASWGNAEREPFRFLHPFRLAAPSEMETLWRFSHDGLDTVPAPSRAALDQAVEDADWSTAAARARAIIATILDMPPVLAVSHQALLDHAVEIVELEAHLAAAPPSVARDYLAQENRDAWPVALQRADLARTSLRHPVSVPPGHPRAATLGWIALQRDFQATVPNGWSDAIRKKVSQATWKRLHADAQAWLARHPKHVLRDLVALHQVRIHYFAGTTDDAWQLLITMLPKRRTRVLAEMRYLLVMGHAPTAKQVDALTHPLLITALASPSRVTAKRFDRWWALSEKKDHRGTAWSHNLQERLLLWAAKTRGPIPAAFPKRRKPPTALWGKLRAAALLRAGQPTAATAQLQLTPHDFEQAELAAKAWLRRNKRIEAAAVPALDSYSRRYIVEVLSSDQELKQLAKHENEALAMHARRELGVRLWNRGKFDAAADLVGQDDPARKALWQRAKALARSSDPDAPLELATLMTGHRGTFFHHHDNGWYRGLSYRHKSLIAGHRIAEARQVERHMEQKSERWQALLLLTRWLTKQPRHAGAASALARADDAYNRLINLGGGNYFFWGQHQKKSRDVASLRRVGRIVRNQPPASTP